MKQERRQQIFRFQTLVELLAHYSEFLTHHQMEMVVKDSARLFLDRDNADEQQSRLEYIKKCEYIMEALVAMKAATVHHGFEN